MTEPSSTSHYSGNPALENLKSTRAWAKRWIARHFPRFRSMRHIKAHINYPRLSFDEAIIRATYRKYFGCEIDLENPKTLAEKLNWLKLTDRRDCLSVVADKWEMRSYVQARGLGHLLNKIYGVFDRAEDVDFSALPDAFVMKVTHGSSMNIIKPPDVQVDYKSACRRLTAWLATDMSSAKGEWQYRNASRRILIERYLEVEGNVAPDYKIHCFNGKPEFIALVEGRFEGLRKTYYSPSWKRMPFRDVRMDTSSQSAPAPSNLDEMISAAKLLAADFPAMRVDFMRVGEKIYLTELTVYTYGGFPKFDPPEYDRKIGDLLLLDQFNPASTASFSNSSQT